VVREMTLDEQQIIDMKPERELRIYGCLGIVTLPRG
jgi:hypothetical protein